MSFSLILQSKMATRKEVLAEATESLQGKVTRKLAEWSEQEVLSEGDPGVKRETVCCNVIVAAEHFHVSRGVFIWVPRDTDVLDLEREFQQES